MSGIRLVIVDDDPDVRMMLNITLSTMPVEVVGEAADGVEAVEVVTRTRPHMVLMDVMMPNMNGIEATQLIKRDAPEVAVIGFTASGAELVEQMLEAGAVAVFDKTNFAPLVEQLSELVGTRA